MTDIPIIFSAPMVRALLGGRKTMTRRLVKLPTKGEYVRPDMGGWEATTVGGHGSFYADGRPAPELVAIWNQTTGTTVAARYQPGDRLWVRESVSRDLSSRPLPYMADHVGDPKGLGWRPSIHMPRWASRLTLEVTAVKIERLQAISDADAKAEGIVEDDGSEPDIWYVPGAAAAGWKIDMADRPSKVFRSLWCALHGQDAWDANPWIVAPTFAVHKINIDQMERAAA